MFTAHKTYKRYELWFADLPAASGSIQRGKRPVLILSNNVGNRYSPTVQVASITSVKKKALPTHVNLNAVECGLRDNSIAMLETMTTIEKEKLLFRIGEVPEQYSPMLDKAGMVQLGYVSPWD